ncbi:MAG: hypothetical protein ACKOW0_01320 [Schleiferiaceae bacterium]
MKNAMIFWSLCAAIVLGCAKEELSTNTPRLQKTTTGLPPNVNAATGVGFVGKGDVQLCMGWNNAQLQANADSLYFRVATDSVWEHQWSCTNTKSGTTVFKSASSKRVGQSTLTSVARVKKQVTGFHLLGYAVAAPSIHVTGPPVGSCGSSPNVVASAVTSSLLEASTSMQVKVGVNGTFVNLY